MEDFKRPNHNDFATSEELKSRNFTGIRHNSITNEQELWVEGHIKLAMNVELLRRDPQSWHRKYEEIFSLHHVEERK
jgi:hypothetical protein